MSSTSSYAGSSRSAGTASNLTDSPRRRPAQASFGSLTSGSASSSSSNNNNNKNAAIQDAQMQLRRLLGDSLDTEDQMGDSRLDRQVVSQGHEQQQQRQRRQHQEQIAEMEQEEGLPTPLSNGTQAEEDAICYVKALYPYSGEDENHLSFEANDIAVVFATEQSGWWHGVMLDSVVANRVGRRGWFPSNYVQEIPMDLGRQAHRRYSLYMQQQGQETDAGSTLADSTIISRETALPFETNLDLLLGRRGTELNTADIDRLLRGSVDVGMGGGELDEDLTSFSMGGDIFGEIAAAAAAGSSAGNGSSRRVQHSTSSTSEDEDDVMSPFSSRVLTAQTPSQDRYNDESAFDSRQRTGNSLTPTLGGAVEDPIDGDWVPKLSTDGRIFYYSIRTGDSAFELPSHANAIPSNRNVAKAPSSDRNGGEGLGYAGNEVRKLSPPPPSRNGVISGDTREDLPPGSYLSANRRSPTAAQASVRGISMYSDDSALDVDYLPSPTKSSARQSANDISLTPRKISLPIANLDADRRSLPRSSRQAYQSNITRYSQLEQLTQDPNPPILAVLEADCNAALVELSEAVQKKTLPPRSSSTFEDAEDSDRSALEQAAVRVNNATRRLLAATDVIIEQPFSSKRSSANSSVNGSARTSMTPLPSSDPESIQGTYRLPHLNMSDFRPLAMKITATESKLMLSVRTSWGLLGTSPAEEAAVRATHLAENYPEAELTAHKKARTAMVAGRSEIDAKLRSDLLVQIRTLSEAISAFMEAVSDHAARGGISASRNAIAAPKRAEPASSLLPAEVLLPLTTAVGGLRGHGYSWRSVGEDRSSRPNSLVSGAQREHPVAAWTKAVPSTDLSPGTVQSLREDSQSLASDLEGLRSILTTLFGSHTSDTLLRPSILPTVTSQVSQFLAKFADFLERVEDVNIAGRVDVDISLEVFAALTGHTPEDILLQGIFTDPQPTESNREYHDSLVQVRALLQELLYSKEKLYDIPPRLLQAVQRLSMMTIPAHTSIMTTSPIQPASVSPLGALESSERNEKTTIGDLLRCFATLASDCKATLDVLERLAQLAETQASASMDTRLANTALRAILAERMAAQSSAAANPSTSNDRLQRRSNGAIGIEDEAAEELDSPRNSSSAGNYGLSSRRSADRSTLNSISSSVSMQKTLSGQSLLYTRGVKSRPSRSNSLAESLGSESSYQSKRDAADELRSAMSEAGIGSPTNHSPSKSKLKQFFGADAPGQTLHRPPTASRETPAFLQADFGYDQISYSSDGSTRGGTLHALVCRLTNHMSADSSYNNAFLMTYRTFTDSNELLEQLKGRYYLDPPANIKSEEFKLWQEQKQKLVRARVINIIKSWVTDYLNDDDETLLDRVAAFAVTLPTESSQQLARIIERRRITGAPRRLTASQSGGTTPSPILPRNMKKIKFLDIDPLELARQLTIMDSKLFCRITAEECLSKAWPKKFNKDMPNFRAIADQSNLVTVWVAMSIVSQTDARKRVATVKHFIAIADKCRQLSNFTTLLQIVAGLNSSAIHRLRRTRELINQRAMSTLTFLGNLMSPENNHALYRDALRMVAPPCVPFLGVYFTDWVMSSEANSDMLRDKPDQINFAKRARVAGSIEQIQLHQATPYNLYAVPALAKWLEEELRIAMSLATELPVNTPTSAEQPTISSTPVDPMHTAYEYSLRIEPKEREDERIARLLSESGFL